MNHRLADALNSGRLIVMAQCLPPCGSDRDAFMTLSDTLPSNLDAIVVADNPDRIRASAFSVAAMLSKTKEASVVLSMATRDRNRLALMSDVLGAAALNIAGILCISGNHQSLGICAQAAAAHDLDSTQFVQAMKKLILHGSGLNGKEMEPPLEIQIGTTVHPYLEPMELNLLRLKKKVSVGADFVLTQAIFDLEHFTQWMNSVRATGLDKRTAIIPSVLPLAGVKEARALQQSRIFGPIDDSIIDRIGMAADPAGEGVAIASEIAIQLKAIPGVRGIHILSGGCESLAGEVIKQAKLKT